MAGMEIVGGPLDGGMARSKKGLAPWFDADPERRIGWEVVGHADKRPVYSPCGPGPGRVAYRRAKSVAPGRSRMVLLYDAAAAGQAVCANCGSDHKAVDADGSTVERCHLCGGKLIRA